MATLPELPSPGGMIDQNTESIENSNTPSSVAIWACGPCGPGGPHGYLGQAGKWSTYGPHGPHTTFLTAGLI
jgi:hypothetical protein